ncbi:MAG TPA: magnesium/cobalt transporter CorA [Acidimicrobiia bacterium]|nr:magnesium/cobalt transporter CorA [Acidimicrobiia bacterium]
MRAWSFRRSGTETETVARDGIASVAADGDSLLWVDLTNPTDDDVAFVVEALKIHDLTAEDLTRGNQRTKLDRFNDHFHVALYDDVLRHDGLHSTEVHIVFREGWLLSVRRAPGGIDPELIDEALRRFERRRGEDGADDEGFVLWAILDVVVDRYFDVTDAVDEIIDEIEELVFNERAEGIPQKLFVLRRGLVRFRRQVGPLREVLNELLRREVSCITEPALVRLQDVLDHVLRVLDLIESQRELLTGLLEGQLAVMSNRTNRVMKLTSSWGAILIVATLITGVYGMNFEHMPELTWYYGYPIALGLIGVVTVALYVYFKRRDWL